MSRYTVSAAAREDLKQICRYVAADSPSAAGRLREIFYQKFRLLARHPLLGQARNDLAEGLRMFPAGNYVILYRQAAGGIAVVQVAHGARDLGALWRNP